MAGHSTDAQVTPGTTGDAERYVMRISRLTIDKLGVKLYDKVSAVVAELIANSYDADATDVRVRLPLATLLGNPSVAASAAGGEGTIEVTDDGHGMTPEEARAHYLQVGRDRRKHDDQGARSRGRSRPVMGRKGIGKLAPFGICRLIEVLSAGGPLTPRGYTVAHFFMDFEKILSDTDEPIALETGPEDQTFRPTPGTTIRLSRFLTKRVPDAEVFHRQLAARFAFAQPDFRIVVEDTRDPDENPPLSVSQLSVPTLDGTVVQLDTRPVLTDGGRELPVSGWLALAKEAYKNEEMAGVRIYARGKIVATTRDFEQPAGFTGEFTLRSYLVGQVTADWLDADDGEDLVRTDRQGILWDSEYGRALRKWGAELIKEIGAASRKPRRERTSRMFLDRSKIRARAQERFHDAAVVETAVQLAVQIGGFAAEDELTDAAYVDDLTEVILSVAPHKALIEAFQEFNRTATGQEGQPIERLVDLFGKTRVAEMASYSQIAAERVRSIQQLETIVFSDHDEGEFQKLLAQAPWLIEPTWSVLTRNQALRTFKQAFETFWYQRTGEVVTLAIDYERKRPDFTLVSVGHRLHVVEIKKAGHPLDDADFKRLINYVYAFDAFFTANQSFKVEFPLGYSIDVVADGTRLNDLANKTAWEKFESDGKIRRVSWTDFLLRAKQAHQQFLEVADESARKQQEVGGGPDGA